MSRALGKDETIANVVMARVFLGARLASVWGVAGQGPPLTTGTDPVNRPLGSGASHSLGMMLTVSGGWVGVSGGGAAPQGEECLSLLAFVGLEIRLTTPKWVRPRRS